MTLNKLEYSQDLIALYSAFKEQVYDPKSVLYPSCGYDASPAEAFKSVTFVDLEQGNSGCIEALKKAGLEAVKSDIRQYKSSDNHDLLILLNPAIKSSWATDHIVPGAFILSNDYHRNASQLFNSHPEFNLWGTLDFVERDRRKEDMRVTISRDTTNLFDPVKNLEEFRKYRPNDFEFDIGTMNHFISIGHLEVPRNTTQEEKWKVYRKSTCLEIPYKRVAKIYVFTKRMTGI